MTFCFKKFLIFENFSFMVRGNFKTPQNCQSALASI